MNVTLDTILLAIAFILFLWAAFGAIVGQPTKINLVALGLALWVVTALTP